MKIFLRDDVFERILEMGVGSDIEQLIYNMVNDSDFEMDSSKLHHINVLINTDGAETSAAVAQLGSLLWTVGEQRNFELECKLLVSAMGYTMQSELFQRELHSSTHEESRWGSSLTRRVRVVGHVELAEVEKNWSRTRGSLELTTVDEGIANANPDDLGFSATVFEQQEAIVRVQIDEVASDIENGTLSIDTINDIYGDKILSETDTRSELEEKVKDLMVWEWEKLENNTSSELYNDLARLSDKVTISREIPIEIYIEGHGVDYELVEE